MILVKSTHIAIAAVNEVDISLLKNHSPNTYAVQTENKIHILEYEKGSLTRSETLDATSIKNYLLHPISASGSTPSYGPYGAYVQTIAITNDTICVGTFKEGIFKSTNAGDNWTDINSGLTGIDVPLTMVAGLTGIDVRTIAINPLNHDLIYAGTFIRGVFKSTNGGSSWFTVNNGLGDNQVSTISDIIIDPVEPETLYTCPFGQGIFKTINGGEEWYRIGEETVLPGRIFALAVDSTNTDIIYAGGGYSDAGVFKSTDGGDTWTEINNGFIGFNKDVRCLLVDPVNPKNLYVAFFPYAGSNQGGIYRSTDAGLTWFPANNGIPSYVNFHSEALAIDSFDHLTVYVAVHGSPNRGGVFKSTDGGQSWISISSGIINRALNSVAPHPSNDQIIYAGSSSQSGGIYRSTDGGMNWSQSNDGLTGQPIFTIVPGDRFVFAGSWDNIFRFEKGAQVCEPVNTGLPLGYTNIYSTIAMDPQQRSTLYAGQTFHSLDGIYKTTNNGDNWVKIATGIPEFDTIKYDMLVDPSDSEIIYTGTVWEGVFKSIDAGNTFYPINVGLTNLKSGALAIDPSLPTTLYCGTDDSGMFKTVNGGNDWFEINNGILAINSIPEIQDIVVNPNDPLVVYIADLHLAGSVNLFKTIDGGANWFPINNGLTELVTSLTINPASPNILYGLAMNGYIFKTSDGGDNWSLFRNDHIYTSIAVDSFTPSILWAAAVGKGIFEIVLDLPLGPIVDFSANITSGYAPLTVQFTDTSIPVTNPITSWSWDFDNDGTVDSDEQSPTHTYAKAGTYTVKLTVSDGTLSNDEIKADYITVEFPIGDMSGDSTVSAYDAALILQFIVGLIDEFPVVSMMGSSPENAMPRHYEVSVPSLGATQGQRIAVPVQINDATGFLAGGVSLKYDATVLKAVGASLELNGHAREATTRRLASTRRTGGRSVCFPTTGHEDPEVVSAGCTLVATERHKHPPYGAPADADPRD